MADSVPPTHPFTHPSADIVFCSSDGVLFKVHKLVLSLASEFFADMFALPQPAAPSSTGFRTESIKSGKAPTELEGLPVVHVSEPGTVLEDLFRLVYPFADPSLVKFDRVRSVFEAALKYQMHEAIAITTRRLLDLAPTEPLRVYAIACLHSLADVVTAAARAVYDQELMDKYVDELEEIPVSAYRRLLLYCGPLQAKGKGTKPSGPFSSALDLEYSDLSSATSHKKPTNTDNASDSTVAGFGPMPLDTPEVIIRTCDEQDIKFPADMLCLFSPVLAARISATPSQPPELPQVITVPESSDVMRPLLAMFHPLTLPPALNAITLVPVLVAAERYQMKKTVWLLRDALTKLESDPSVDVVWLYFVACRFGMRSLAHAAARRCFPLQDLATSSFANVDFPGVSAGTFWRLLDYQRRCRTAIRSMFDADTVTWMSEEWQKKVKFCHRGSSFSYANACWFNPYLTCMRGKAWLSSADATSESVFTDSSSNAVSCPYCARGHGIARLFSFAAYVKETLEARESEVPLEWKGVDVTDAPGRSSPAESVVSV
ncbi:hypothetical protein PYCCODRAFT_1465389 [Trametes coccinea BRFM310]|uniref:BTB domain-containing protein n=1 Tax=Trametes coccinea (strain BRFM310) TaxID=1353009 RepID=A0A1Y2IWJ3_TRAC3|nr:hypothetical protein PYCCODRAFT_1465389 [Trametes coccinea BRFM310]